MKMMTTWLYDIDTWSRGFRGCVRAVSGEFRCTVETHDGRTTYAKLVSKLVRNSAKTLLMYILLSGAAPGNPALLQLVLDEIMLHAACRR
jgi:hypothetical protein